MKGAGVVFAVRVLGGPHIFILIFLILAFSPLCFGAEESLTIRWGLRPDVEAIMEIEKEGFATPWTKEQLNEIVTERASIMAVAVQDGKVVGFVIYELHQGHIEIRNLAVSKSSRGQGVARALVDKLMRKLTPEGRRALIWNLRKDMKSAHEFAKHLGFESERTFERFYIDGTAAESFVLHKFPAPEINSPEVYSLPQDQIFSLANGKFRMGAEVETRAHSALVALIRYYEVDVDRNRLMAADLDGYLEDSSKLRFLPESLRETLTAGLPLGKAKEELKLSSPVADGLQVPEWAKSTSVLEAPTARLILPGAGARPLPTWKEETIRPPLYVDQPKPLELSASAVHGEIERRWRALPLETKQEAVDVRELSPQVLAWLVVRGKATMGALREETSPQVKSILSSWESENQGTWREFRHQKKMVWTNPEAYLQNVEGIFHLAQVSSQLNDPVKPRSRPNDASYHIHISAADARELSKWATHYNNLLLMRGIALGFGPQILETKSHVRYDMNIYNKGLLRLVERNRIELRDHYKSPREELKEVLELLLLPEEVAITRMNNEIQDLLTPENRQYLERIRPEVFYDVAFESYKYADMEHKKEWASAYDGALCRRIATIVPH